MERDHRLKEVADEFREIMNEIIDHYVIVHDVPGLQGLVRTVKKYQSERLKQSKKKMGDAKE